MDKNDGGKEKRRPLEVFERIWSQALVAVTSAEDEASKVGARMADVAGWSQEELKRHVRDMAERLATQRKALEANVEEGVRGTLARLKVPRREEMSALGARLEAVARRIAELEARR